MPPRRPADYLGRYGVLLVLMSVPYFAVSYLARVMGALWDTALLLVVSYLLVTAVENIVAIRVCRMCPPTWLLVTSLTLDYLFGVAGAVVPMGTGLTLLACLCAVSLVASWYRGVRAIVERGWLIPRALSSGDPEAVRRATERRRIYDRLDRSLLEYGWVRSE